MKETVYHYLYKITNLINQKIYIGVHSTNNLEDNYMGSGVYLQRAIKKYGKENFKKEILEFFNTSKDKYLSESKIVNEEFINKKDNYNIVIGGKGLPCGFTYVKNSEGKIFYIETDDIRILSGELVGVTKNCIQREETKLKISKSMKIVKQSLSEKEKLDLAKKASNNFNNKGKVSVRDKNGDTFVVSNEDSRFLSGELIHVTKGLEPKCKGKIKITNGFNNTHIFKTESIPQGWWKGSCIKGMKYKKVNN